MTTFDILIRGGTLIDGSGTARRRADIGIVGDRLAAVGDLAGSAAGTIIEAAGKIVAPGFIDVHNHSDGWLWKLGHLQPKTIQGFTTEILMADGISYAPVNQFTARQWLYYLRALNGLRLDDYDGWLSWHDYLQGLEGRSVQNFAAHLPYANYRVMSCGFGRAAADDFQIRQMQLEIRLGMEQGAVGLSTGLDYLGQCFAGTDELVAACEPLRSWGGLYVSHVRYKRGLLPALREAVEIGRRAEVPVHISHLKAQSPVQTEEVLEFLEQARREVDLSFDVYPYQPGSTMLNYLLPYEAWEDGPLAVTARMQQPEMRERFAAGLRAYRLDLEQIRLAWVATEHNRAHCGRTLREYVEWRGRPAEEALFDLLLEEGLAVLCVMNEGDDALVRPFLAHDLYMMGSDGIYHPEAQVHPRMYGSSGRLLGPCVRQWKLFSLEGAVERLSGRAASRFGLARRGLLREGYYADVVVFDEHQVGDPATFEQPCQWTVGIEQVLINGVPVVAGGRPLDLSERPPGRFLRFEKM
ncbi:MAG: amidohydrolase family protein [Pirellulaceae bacterium]|nr:amidohydrolase family protein [Pirellulaceae bacterium]